MVGMQLHKMIKFLNYRQLELHHGCSTFTRLESNFFTNISWDAIGTELQCKKLQCKKNWSLNLTFFGNIGLLVFKFNVFWIIAC